MIICLDSETSSSGSNTAVPRASSVASISFSSVDVVSELLETIYYRLNSTAIVGRKLSATVPTVDRFEAASRYFSQLEVVRSSTVVYGPRSTLRPVFVTGADRMEASSSDAASQRTLRFVCGCRNDAIVSKSSCQNVTTTAAPTLKRQRVTETSIVEVRLVEFIRDLDETNEENDKHYGLFVWPSALLLSRFIAQEEIWLCRDKVVLELGCGTGLPSILAGLCGATKVYLTDRDDAVDVQRNAEANIKLNRLEGCAEFLPLTWGDMLISDEIVSIFQTVQVVLAADCFYQSEDFEKVIATVALIFRYSTSTSVKFYFTYQLRSINRSIAPLLSRWGLTAKSIDKSEFVNDVDDVQDFDSIYLYEVKAQD